MLSLIFVIFMLCLVGVDIKIVEKLSFKFCPFAPLSLSYMEALDQKKVGIRHPHVVFTTNRH